MYELRKEILQTDLLKKKKKKCKVSSLPFSREDHFLVLELTHTHMPMNVHTL